MSSKTSGFCASPPGAPVYWWSYVINPPRGFTVGNSTPHIPFVVALENVHQDRQERFPNPRSGTFFVAHATLHPVEGNHTVDDGRFGGQWDVQGRESEEDVLWSPLNDTSDSQFFNRTVLYFCFDNVKPTQEGNYKIRVEIKVPDWHRSFYLCDELVSTVSAEGKDLPGGRLQGLPSSGQLQVFQDLPLLPGPGPGPTQQWLASLRSNNNNNKKHPFDIMWVETRGGGGPPESAAYCSYFPSFKFYSPDSLAPLSMLEGGVQVRAYVSFVKPSFRSSSSSSSSKKKRAFTVQCNRLQNTPALWWEYPQQNEILADGDGGGDGAKLNELGVWTLEMWIVCSVPKPEDGANLRIGHYPRLGHRKATFTVS
ncbi:hypothetical protein QBC43DRAFT_286113 [Cladorrhinum sp. PSN259]|nr:hypothetical protein QBC43DRAFT_286113 [Cladorrhinum sp. PSN259]